MATCLVQRYVSGKMFTKFISVFPEIIVGKMLKNTLKKFLDPDADADNFQNAINPPCPKIHLWRNYHEGLLHLLGGGNHPTDGQCVLRWSIICV